MPQPPSSRLPRSTQSHRSNVEVEAPFRDLNASLSGPVDTFESYELKEDSIPKDFPGLEDYALVACEVVSNGEDVGYMYMKEFNTDEWNIVYGVNGMVHKHLHLPLAATTKSSTDTEKSVRLSGKKHSNFHYETKLRLTCKASNCPCASLVCRVQIGSTKGILYYENEKIDVQSGKPYRHSNHREYSSGNLISLTYEQMELEFLIKKWFQKRQRQVNAEEIKSAVVQMLHDDNTSIALLLGAGAADRRQKDIHQACSGTCQQRQTTQLARMKRITFSRLHC